MIYLWLCNSMLFHRTIWYFRHAFSYLTHDCIPLARKHAAQLLPKSLVKVVWINVHSSRTAVSSWAANSVLRHRQRQVQISSWEFYCCFVCFGGCGVGRWRQPIFVRFVVRSWKALLSVETKVPKRFPIRVSIHILANLFRRVKVGGDWFRPYCRKYLVLTCHFSNAIMTHLYMDTLSVQ